MTQKEKLLQLHNLQNTLNNMTNGSEWTNGITNKGKQINWYNCMLLEGAEAIDSTPWKHWKAIEGKTDWENIKIEVVDIFHFLLSESIRLYGINKSHYISNDILTSFEFNYSSSDFKIFNQEMKLFMFKVLSLDLEVGSNNVSFPELFYHFFKLLELCNMTFDEMYNLYIMKNALNKIRQDNGYKEGKYVKIWEGVEDNVYLYNLLKDQPNLVYEDILDNLQNKYNSLKK